MSKSIRSDCPICSGKMEHLLNQTIETPIPLDPLNLLRPLRLIIPPEVKGKKAVIYKCNVCGFIDVYIRD